MYTYIIVDDEPLIRRGMLKKLKAFSEEAQFVGEADNGIDALELIREVNPDIIFTDMRMPEMDGKVFLKTLQNDFPEKKLIVISGYSDFEYMQEAISAKVVDYLLKPFNREEIHSALQKAINLINQERAYQLKLETTETENEKIKYQSDLQVLNNVILGISKNFEPKSTIFQTFDESHQFILFTLYSTIGLVEYLNNPVLIENIRTNGIINIPNTENDNIYFFLSYYEKNARDLQQLITLKSDLLYESVSSSGTPKDCIYLGISKTKKTLLQLNEAYTETISALNNRVATDINNILFYLEGQINTFENPYWEKTDELLFHIESGHTGKVLDLTTEYFNFICEIPALTIFSLKNLCNDLIHEVRNMLSNYFDSITKDSPSSSFESMLETVFDIESIKTYFFQVLPSLTEVFREKNIYGSENLIDNIKTYVIKNYNKEITLNKISTLFFINPSYCSYLFKEKTGENFNDFVNRIRIEKAKELLKSSPEKVYKIAKTLGYDNTKYFFRVFKKVTGYTPEEYRMM
ncbi:response regulator [Neobacillus sp. OS1-33]|uniref:response regulator transcription factor n=1 Tax=Neobacillus sp. OS1-33 TaxID=3070683 RepID=UPI0027E0F366|nr:response regulator [Neobacillus sp. OS1-33]WML28396.1 response regulator [Neobacillus sp. OS1-33]